MLDTRVYTLLMAAEKGSYTLAAKALNLTQPAVSQHIRALEEELDVKIFERVGNRLLLTREGETVVDYARIMLSQYNNLRAQLRSELSGKLTLNIGITHTMESNTISETLARYATRSQGITIQLLTDTISNLRDRLARYELDFAIVDGRINDPALENIPLDMDQLMLIVAPDSPLAKRSVVTIAEMQRENLILRLPRSATRDLFNASLESRNIDINSFHVILEVDNIATIKDLVRGGYGVSVLARSACLNELRKKKLAALPIENLSMTREINLVSNRDFKHPEVLREIVEIYREL